MENLLKVAESIDPDKKQTIKTLDVKLEQIGSWPETHHVVEHSDILAMIAALGSERALLLTGDPGVGKSHLSRVAAELTNRYFVPLVIKPDDDISDLLWSVDYTQRLADAQLAAAAGSSFNPSLEAYLRPGPIWHAFEQPDEKLTSHYQVPSQKTNRDRGVVLLIDEIDKGSISLLNSLLEVLGNMSFDVPLLGRNIRCETPPLIILTSNQDIELPLPLLRRCVTHEVSLPMEKDAFFERMQLISKAQMKDKYSNKVSLKCAELIFNQRGIANEYKPGASEFLDLLRALHLMAPNNTEAQLDVHFKNIARYFLKSNLL